MPACSRVFKRRCAHLCKIRLSSVTSHQQLSATAATCLCRACTHMHTAWQSPTHGCYSMHTAQYFNASCRTKYLKVHSTGCMHGNQVCAHTCHACSTSVLLHGLCTLSNRPCDGVVTLHVITRWHLATERLYCTHKTRCIEALPCQISACLPCS
jgi:hypothetical protein